MKNLKLGLYEVRRNGIDNFGAWMPSNSFALYQKIIYIDAERISFPIKENQSVLVLLLEPITFILDFNRNILKKVNEQFLKTKTKPKRTHYKVLYKNKIGYIAEERLGKFIKQ